MAPGKGTAARRTCSTERNKEESIVKKYNVSCPCCGHSNNNLYLDETEGWMECEKCGELTQVSKRVKRRVKIRIFREENPGGGVYL